jgi:hypothetical protein
MAAAGALLRRFVCGKQRMHLSYAEFGAPLEAASHVVWYMHGW